MNPARIGVLGDYDEQKPTHIATDRALQEAAHDMERYIEVSWLGTDRIHDLSSYDAFVCGPGGPYKDLAKGLQSITAIRESGKPTLGTCGGFQHMALEFAHNVLGRPDTGHAEYAAGEDALLIDYLSCSLVGQVRSVSLVEGSRAWEVYGSSPISESFHCRFGIHPDFVEQLDTAGFRVTGTDEQHEPRILELQNHPFYIATLFVPQMRCLQGEAVPLFSELLRQI
ncbi:MAG: hypothetical protein QM758_01395 [Armatimonas sp.]